MKRDFEVIKKILLHAKETGNSFREVPGVSEIEFFDNAELLCDAGLIKLTYFNETMITVQRLTWHGHDAADFMLKEGAEKLDWSRFVR